MNRDTEALAQLAPPKDASLTELQEWMVRVLRHPRALHKSEAMRSAAAAHFSGNDRLLPAEQVDIYRQQFWLRHTSTLVEDFPGLTGLLGQRRWEPIVEGYLSTKSHDCLALRSLGKDLSDHIESLDESLIENEGLSRVLLVEMARLEWAYIRAFDLRDEPPLSPARLAEIPVEAWQHARFEVSDTVSLFRFQYPVADLRRTIRKAPGEISTAKVEVDPNYLVVYRRNRTLWDKRLSRSAFLLLEQLSRGIALVPACEAVVTEDPEAERVLENQLTEWFTLWGRLGWIIDVKVDP